MMSIFDNDIGRNKEELNLKINRSRIILRIFNCDSIWNWDKKLAKNKIMELLI